MPPTWNPSSSDYVDLLQGQNPWHEIGKVPESLCWPKRRALAEGLWRSLARGANRFQLILGPRRVGKTVTLYQTTQSLLSNGVRPLRVWHMNMQSPLLMHFDLGTWIQTILRSYRSDPGETLYFLIDEIDYTAHWDRWLKTMFDERWPIQVVATSSSIAALRSRTVESGIGRWSELFLTPYSFAEFLDLVHDFKCPLEAAPTLEETIRLYGAVGRQTSDMSETRRRFLVVGGFPELIQSADLRAEDVQSALIRSQRTLQSEAVQRVAGMDLPQVFDIRHPIILERLLYILSQQMTGLINVSNLAKSLEITRATTHQYIAYLEKAFLIFTLPNYSAREESIQRKGRKVYFVDGAVRNAALQRGLAPLSDPAEMGFLIENAAASHLYALSLQEGSRVFHWRKGKREVDLIYGHLADPIAFEITTKQGHALAGLRSLIDEYPRFSGRAYLVSSAPATTFIPPEESTDGVGRIPFDTFLLAVSVQTRKALHDRLAQDV